MLWRRVRIAGYTTAVSGLTGWLLMLALNIRSSRTSARWAWRRTILWLRGRQRLDANSFPRGRYESRLRLRGGRESSRMVTTRGKRGWCASLNPFWAIRRSGRGRDGSRLGRLCLLYVANLVVHAFLHIVRLPFARWRGGVTRNEEGIGRSIFRADLVHGLTKIRDHSGMCTTRNGMTRVRSAGWLQGTAGGI